MGDIANDFMDSMGSTERSGKARCRRVAVNHGTSENGNHHIHLAVSLVGDDGTKASTHGDYTRAQESCRELEVKYGLEQLSTVHATRGYDRGIFQAERYQRELGGWLFCDVLGCVDPRRSGERETFGFGGGGGEAFGVFRPGCGEGCRAFPGTAGA